MFLVFIPGSVRLLFRTDVAGGSLPLGGIVDASADKSKLLCDLKGHRSGPSNRGWLAGALVVKNDHNSMRHKQIWRAWTQIERGE